MHQQRPRPAVTERPFRDRRDAGRVLAERLRHYASRDDVVRDLRIPPLAIERVAQRETRELARRERVSRDSRRMTDLTGKVVILVDDGLATGSGMRAAIQALRELGPARIVVAVPAAPESTCRELGSRPTRWCARRRLPPSTPSERPTGTSPRPTTRCDGS
jgi:predicted phosphoribosyltransferase